MAIDPKSALFQAILSMDAYNRGYNYGVDLGGGENAQAINTMLGNVKIIANSTLAFDGADQAAGFYAIAYKQPDGSVTISYRGTDALFGTDTQNGPIGGDLWNSYSIALGAIGSPQAALAFKFYNDVAQEVAGSNTADPFTANISVTGHSLGGGLAGLVGA